MPRTGRPGLSAQQKKELWIRWKDSQSLSEIGRSLGKHAGSIHGVLSASGGIAPRDPPNVHAHDVTGQLAGGRRPAPSVQRQLLRRTRRMEAE